MQLPQMLLHVPALLSKEALEQTDSWLPLLQFTDGKATATGAAKAVKNNLQASGETHPVYPQFQQLVAQSILQNPLLQTAVMPVRIRPPLISKYETGMHYGWHTDSPLVGEDFVIRADVSITVFLNHPREYEGGELVIHSPGGYVNYKLAKGDAVVYPTTRLHGVNAVTSGCRTAAVTWMQCAVKDPGKRELLFQLKSANDRIAVTHGETTEHLLLLQVYSNLVRMWAEV